MKRLNLILAAAAAAALAGGGTLRTAAEDGMHSLENQLRLIAADRASGLAERLDARAEEPSAVPDPAEPVGALPQSVWRFGDFSPQPPVAVWQGRMSATARRITFDFAGCPAWFEAAVTDEVMFEVAAFWTDGGELVGGKFDWINFKRNVRDLDHTNVKNALGNYYRNWDGRFAGQTPARAVIVNTKLGEWMVFE